MAQKEEMNYWLDTDDHRRRLEDEHDNASQKFQNLVDRCLEDGVLTRAEVTMLVQQHNEMQQVSRDTLKSLLEKHNYSQLAPRLASKPVVMPRADVTYTTKGATRGKGSKNWTSGVQKLDLDLYKDTIKDKLVSPFGNDKVRFAMITGPAAFFFLLRLLGAF